MPIGMVVFPGAEMTRNTINRDTSVHVLALGLDEFCSADGDPLDMLREIRSRGAVSVACHPHEMSEWFANTWYLWNRRKHRRRRSWTSGRSGAAGSSSR